MGLFSKKETPSETIAPAPVVDSNVVSPTSNGMVYVDANGNSVNGASYIDSNGNPSVNITGVSADINQVLPTDNAPVLEAPVINIPSDPMEVVTNTAATVEEPKPIVEQQIAYDIDPNEVFEGRPIEDQITDIVSSTINNPIAAEQPVANPIPVDIASTEPSISPNIINEPSISMENPTPGIEIISPEVNPIPGIEIISPEVNPSDGIQVVTPEVVSQDNPLPLVSETIIAPPVIENNIGSLEPVNEVEPQINNVIQEITPVDITPTEVNNEVIAPNIVNEPVADIPTIEVQPVTDITAEIQPITPEIINPVVDVVPQEAQVEIVNNEVPTVEPVSVQPTLEQVVVQDVQPVVEQPVIEQPVVETIVEPVVESVVEQPVEVQPVAETVVEQNTVTPEVVETVSQDVIEPVVEQPVVEVVAEVPVESAPVENNQVSDDDINNQIDNLLGIAPSDIEPVDPTVLGGTPDVQPEVSEVVQEVQPVMEPAPQQPVVETVVESVAEPVVETVVEPVVDAVVEPVVEPVVESVAEPVVEPVVESVAEPVVDVVSEPVVESVAEPVPVEAVLDENEVAEEPTVEVINPVEVANLENIANIEEQKISNEVDNLLQPEEPIKLEEFDGPVIPEEKEDNIFSEVNNEIPLVVEVKEVPVEAVVPTSEENNGPIIVEEEENIFTDSDSLPPVTSLEVTPVEGEISVVAEETPVVETASNEVNVSQPVDVPLETVEEVETLGEEILDIPVEEIPVENNQAVSEETNNLTEIDLLMANSRTETTRFCDNCGAMLGINDQTVCPNCGEPIK